MKKNEGGASEGIPGEILKEFRKTTARNSRGYARRRSLMNNRRSTLRNHGRNCCINLELFLFIYLQNTPRIPKRSPVGILDGTGKRILEGNSGGNSEEAS